MMDEFEKDIHDGLVETQERVEELEKKVEELESRLENIDYTLGFHNIV